MKKIFIVFILLLISGCEKFPFSKNQDTVLNSNNSNIQNSNDQCPQQPPSTSKSEDMDLDNSTTSEILRLKAGEVKVYKFEGEKGKIFEHSYDKDICFWVYDPKGDLINLDESLELKMDGTHLVLMSIPEGTVTVNLEMSLQDKAKPVVKNSPLPSTDNKTQNNQIENNPIDNNSKNVNVSRNSPPPQRPTRPTHDITQREALNIVEGWYSAKGQIFGYPFDRSLLNKYATGNTYYENGEKDGGGSIAWLQRNNCYYTYGYSNIENIVAFNNSGNRPYLKVRVFEKLQLHGPKNLGCGNRPKSYRTNVTYWFAKDSGKWKITDYVVE